MASDDRTKGGEARYRPVSRRYSFRVVLGAATLIASGAIGYDIFAFPRAPAWEVIRQWFSWGSKRGLLDDGGGLYVFWGALTSIYGISCLATAKSSRTRTRQVFRVALGVALVAIVGFVFFAAMGAQGSR